MDLEPLRKQISEKDREILRLLNERAKVAQEIGHMKQQENVSIYSPHREREVLNWIETDNPGPLKTGCIKAIYRELMSGCLDLEKPLRVCYFGLPGSFTHLAAHSRFGSSVEYVPIKGIDGVFLEVIRGDSDYGVVPIENSTEGGVGATMDMFIESAPTDIAVCAEILLPIHHHLLARCEPAEVKRIYSHPQALGQCKGWISNTYGKADLFEVASTTKACELSKQQTGSAAIASLEAARIYDLQVLHKNIEDSAHNVTRFLVLGKQSADPSPHSKTAVVFSVDDQSGALVDLLHPMKELSINMTRIESRPSKKKPWDYNFFIDMEGHEKDDSIRQVIQKISDSCQMFKVLGSFPAAKPEEGSAEIPEAGE